MITGVELMQSRYEAFERHAREKGYCDPFVPFVGAQYAAASPKVVYCGVAPRYTDLVRFGAIEEAATWSRDAALEWDISSDFWRLLERLIARLGGGLTRRDIVWTNVSKLCTPDGRTAPPASDRELHRLNVEQLREELETLAPDLLLCVSGSALERTALDVFGDFKIAHFAPETPKTWARLTPWGGVLLWTMHPGRKSRGWGEQVTRDAVALMNGG